MGLEFEANSYVNIVSRYAISPVLASTLMGRPDFRDIGISTCAQFRYALVKVFNNLDSSIYGGSSCAGGSIHLVEKIIAKAERKDGTFHSHVAKHIHLSDTARLIYTATSMIHVRSSGICAPGNEFSSNYSVVYASACLILPWAEKLTRQSPSCCVRPEQRVDTLCVRTFSVFECLLSIDRAASLGNTRAFEYPTD